MCRKKTKKNKIQKICVCVCVCVFFYDFIDFIASQIKLKCFSIFYPYNTRPTKHQLPIQLSTNLQTHTQWQHQHRISISFPATGTKMEWTNTKDKPMNGTEPTKFKKCAIVETPQSTTHPHTIPATVFTTYGRFKCFGKTTGTNCSEMNF